MNVSTSAATLPKHLRRLEAETIEIMREVVAEFKNPVMLYSIGKDSSVMLHLAIKAFHPAPLPFPLMHVDTTWKFRDMITFRDETAKRLGFKLLVYINQDGVDRGISPIASGSSVHTHVMKTEALKKALDLHGFDAAFGGARRDDAPLAAKGGAKSGYRPIARWTHHQIHALTHSACRPIAFMLSGGQVADCTAGELLLEQMPQASMLHGNAIERMFGRLKDFRRIDTRYDRLADNFLAAVCLAAVVSYWL